MCLIIAQHRDRKNNLSGIKLEALSEGLQRLYKAAIKHKGEDTGVAGTMPIFLCIFPIFQNYRQIPNTRHTESPKFNVSHLVLYLSLPNQLNNNNDNIGPEWQLFYVGDSLV